MGLDAFTARLGIDQGRVVREDNTVVLALGSIQAGHMADLDDGDEVSISQSVDFGANPTDAIRATGTLFSPQDVTDAGFEWQLTLAVSGLPLLTPVVRSLPGQTRAFDLTIDTGGLSDVRTVTIRLALSTI